MSHLLDIGKNQSEIFLKNNVAYCELLVTANSIRKLMNYVYNALVRFGKITPLEKLSQEDKIMSWNTAKDFAKGRLEQKELIEVVKALHALEYYL